MRESRIVLLVLCLFLTFPVLAEQRLTQSAMRAQGIQPRSFQPIAFSHDDRWLAGFDRASFEEKKEGTFYRLWFFKLGREGELDEAKSVPLNLKSLQQGEFTPDDKAFVVIGNRGTTFLKVSLEDFEVSSLLEPSWGTPGFRADPAVLWTENEELYVLGYPYDEARFVDPKTVATVTQDGSFEAGPNLTAVEQPVERLWFTNYLGPRSAFFGQKYPTVTILSHWDGEEVFEFDRAPRFTSFWGNGGRLLYSAERSEEQKELLVYDVESGEKTVLASQADSYRYLFLSRDGETALVSLAVPDTRLEPYIARASNDWELVPLVTDRKQRAKTVAAGWMRLSSTGKFVCHVSSTGIALYSVP